MNFIFRAAKSRRERRLIQFFSVELLPIWISVAVGLLVLPLVVVFVARWSAATA